ncbi:MAG: HEAT repeat domain-containing protein [Alkalinema sp. RU_4_3]|nr:HEAT repeat domain-containing protein [Alkalinema sp. RU_4_3]
MHRSVNPTTKDRRYSGSIERCLLGGIKSAIPSLIPLLKDLNAEVRSNAAYALGTMGDSAKSTIPSLIPLLNDSEYFVRSSATRALKKLGYLP